MSPRGLQAAPPQAARGRQGRGSGVRRGRRRGRGGRGGPARGPGQGPGRPPQVNGRAAAAVPGGGRALEAARIAGGHGGVG